ncbi:MAG: hypothetical protein KDI75_01355 [Xanthomonadales bacterium]|nr:hypothetical protein [Xanthomonadales bacterium]
MAVFALLLALPLASGQADALARDDTAAAAMVESRKAVDPAMEDKLAAIEDVGKLRGIALGFEQRKEWNSAALTWKRLTILRPHVGRYKLEMAAAYARQDKKSEAYTALLELQAQGYAYDIREDGRFGKIATTEVWKYILTGFDANRVAFGDGSVAYTLPKDDLLIDSLAWDATHKALLVGSARKGEVYVVGKGGKLKPLVRTGAASGMWAVMDLVVDAKRNRLWVASTAIPHFEGYVPETDLGRAGVFEFALDSGKFLHHYLSPASPGLSFFLSSLALGKDGEVYAADGVNNAVYLVRDGQFKRLFHAPRLTSIRGMTVSDDGKRLYFADHELGVMGVELATGKPFDLLVPKNLALGGIEGMKWWKDSLILVQNDMKPERVMRLQLDESGRSVAKVMPLAANQPDFDSPTMLTLAGDDIYLIANSQKDNYDRFGLVRDKRRLEGARIYRLDANSVKPEMDINPFLEIGSNPSKKAAKEQGR